MGAVGVNGWTLITTLPDAEEVHPPSKVTVKVNVFAARPEIVVLVPVPVVVTAPGVLASVHVPDEGNPFRTTLPVAAEQVGWVIVPTVGAVGVNGLAFTTALAEEAEVHPEEFVTVKLYVLAARPEIVVLVPVPDVVVLPGVLVIVQVPDEGKPLKITLPVPIAQDGWVIVPTTGAVGVTGCVLITTLADAVEIHPEELVTVKVYVPVARPEIVVLVPVPVVVVPPGFLVKVHEPDEGNPLIIILPVATVHVGWVIVPVVGAVGVDGCESITALPEAVEVHPEALVTVKV